MLLTFLSNALLYKFDIRDSIMIYQQKQDTAINKFSRIRIRDQVICSIDVSQRCAQPV